MDRVCYLIYLMYLWGGNQNTSLGEEGKKGTKGKFRDVITHTQVGPFCVCVLEVGGLM